MADAAAQMSSTDGLRTDGLRHVRFGAAGFDVPPGVTYKCFGPWPLPPGPGSLQRFQPDVDMSIVHHMILFGGTSRFGGCGGRILYAWARTGQSTPIPLNLAAANASGLGFEVGERGGLTHVSLQVHYQRSVTAPVQRGDNSGVRLALTSTPPATPLHVQLNQLIPYIPARSVVDLCVRCTVVRGGMVFAFRNHAHRLGRHIWSDHFRLASGRFQPLPPLGLMDTQLPQIVRTLAEPVRVDSGDVLQLHCMYNSTLRNQLTGYSIDEAKGEMCNQYLFANRGFFTSCSSLGRKCDPSPSRHLTSAVTTMQQPSQWGRSL
jgi:hypothetical protein